jgi:hypothetical protein
MASPDLVLFPSQVRDLFFNVKGSFLEEIRIAQEAQLQQAREATQEKERLAALEQARVARLEHLAQQETLVLRNRRWMASVPFGVGQFQNGKPGLGSLFLVTEGALVMTAIIAVSRELSLHSQADGGKGVSERVELINSSLNTARSVPLWAIGSFLLIAAAGVAEAHLNFVDEVRIGERERSDAPRPGPAGAPAKRMPRSGTQKASSLPRPIINVGAGHGLIGVQGSF